MGVAARVAEELGVALGREVGYSIRFEEVATPVRLAQARPFSCVTNAAHEPSVRLVAPAALWPASALRLSLLPLVAGHTTLDTQTSSMPLSRVSPLPDVASQLPCLHRGSASQVTALIAAMSGCYDGLRAVRS